MEAHIAQHRKQYGDTEELIQIYLEAARLASEPSVECRRYLQSALSLSEHICGYNHPLTVSL
jgi:hypothetical protein